MINHNLTVPQQRKILTTFRLFEEALRNTDRLIVDGDRKCILYSFRTNLSTKKNELIRSKIKETLSYLAIVSKELELKPREYSIERIIKSEMSLCWESLEECRPKRMKGYGEYPLHNKESIESMIDHLTGSINFITALADNEILENDLEIFDEGHTG